MISEIRIEDYNYTLPDERIAKYPLENRDDSKLLIYKESHPYSAEFRNIAEYLPEGSLMVFNDTKVVPARLHFQKTTTISFQTRELQNILLKTEMIQSFSYIEIHNPLLRSSEI